MTNPNSSLVLAGVAAGGATGLELMWVAPTDTTLPTDTTTLMTVVDSSWEGMGYISSDGITLGVDESWEEIGAYGASSAVRKVCKSTSRTIQVEWLEHNLNVLEVFNRLDLGTISPDATGAFSISHGTTPVQRYEFVVDVVDDVNHIRHVIPSAEVTDIKEQKIANGMAITHSATITAYPDGSGVSIYSYYLIPDLATS